MRGPGERPLREEREGEGVGRGGVGAAADDDEDAVESGRRWEEENALGGGW